MAIPRNGSRIIVVDGERYRWRVRGKPTYCQELAWSNLMLAAEAAGAVGSVLIIGLPQAHPSNYMNAGAVPVLPAEVAAHIRRALAAGWQPTCPGVPFLMDAAFRQKKSVPA